MERFMRRLLLPGFVLALVIVGASVTLRLAANGIGCTPWPTCYGQATTVSAAQGTLLVQALRLIHRITASAFLFVALAIVILGWKRWQRSARVVGVTLLLVTVLLAWVGLHTPSPLPAVTLTNVLGGFSLLALLAWLLATTRVPTETALGTSARFALIAPAVLLLALALQVASGAMISVRLAGDACATGCEQTWLSGATALLNPLAPGSARELLNHQLAGQPLHTLHRFGGLALAMVTFAVALASAAQRNAPIRRASRLMAYTLLLGVLVATLDGPLMAVVIHALLASLAGAGLSAALATRRMSAPPPQ